MKITVCCHPQQENRTAIECIRKADIERLKLVEGARRLDIPLAEIKEILNMRDQGEAPCTVLLDMLATKADEVEIRIQELKQLQSDLRGLHDLGLRFPTVDIEGKNCVCHLVSEKSVIKTP